MDAVQKMLAGVRCHPSNMPNNRGPLMPPMNEVGVTDRHSPSSRTPEARRTIEVWFPRNVGVSRQRTETVR